MSDNDDFKRGSIKMDFDSLKVTGRNSVKSDYSNNKTYDNVKSDSESSVKDTQLSGSEKVRTTEKAAQDTNKYSEDDLYKGENFQDKMGKAIDVANEMLKPANKSFSYSVHEETKEIMIQIKDDETGEVIKEIPSEESLDMVAKMRELAGIVVDEKR
jgi:flagellar protein FlaG